MPNVHYDGVKAARNVVIFIFCVAVLYGVPEYGPRLYVKSAPQAPKQVVHWNCSAGHPDVASVPVGRSVVPVGFTRYICDEGEVVVYTSLHPERLVQ